MRFPKDGIRSVAVQKKVQKGVRKGFITFREPANYSESPNRLSCSTLSTSLGGFSLTLCLCQCNPPSSALPFCPLSLLTKGTPRFLQPDDSRNRSVVLPRSGLHVTFILFDSSSCIGVLLPALTYHWSGACTNEKPELPKLACGQT